VKRLILAGFLFALFMVPVHAKAQQLGLYVTPKFIYGGMIMDNTKGHLDARFQGTLVEAESWKLNGSDHAFGGSLAIGYNFNTRLNVPVRAEIEYALFSDTKNKTSHSGRGFDDNGDLVWGENSSFEQRFGVQTLFFNAYYDFHNSTAFTPYIGAGLGMAFINTKAKNNSTWYDSFNDVWETDEWETWSTGSKRNTNFAWNVGAGVAYNFTENVALDLGYRFVGLGSAKTRTRVDVDPADWGSNDITRHTGSKTDLYMHQVGLGLRFSF